MKAFLRNNFFPPFFIGLTAWGLVVLLFSNDAVPDSYKDEASLSEEKSIASYHMEAERGDVESQYWLGYLYGVGEGVETDLVEAFKWTSLAAEQGHAKAQNYLDGI